jgi:hypothetical protein
VVFRANGNGLLAAVFKFSKFQARNRNVSIFRSATWQFIDITPKSRSDLDHGDEIIISGSLLRSRIFVVSMTDSNIILMVVRYLSFTKLQTSTRHQATMEEKREAIGSVAAIADLWCSAANSATIGLFVDS